MLLKIQFLNELGLINYKFNTPQRQASFINTQFYLYFGGDNYQFQLLQASIYDLKFEYNYEQDKSFFIGVCHYSCSQCDGPLGDHCLSCDANSNRLYLNEQKICICKKGFVDLQGEMICQLFVEQYNSVVIKKVQNAHIISCQSGYFQYKSSDNSQVCIECPQKSSNDILCADCYYYPEKWYKNPICTKDLISRNQFPNDAYSTQERLEIDFDVYLIDETFNLILIDGVSDYCNSGVNCYQTNLKHLGELVNVKCKNNYYFSDFKCLKPDSQCLEANNQGKCVKCNFGLYLLNNQCLLCPLNCMTCQFDLINQKPICLSCKAEQTVVEGQCVRCGQNCQICQFSTHQTTNISYLKCLKCIDNSKYFISIDGINCLENTLENCLYAFQALIIDITVNTIDVNFAPLDPSSQITIVTYCSLCKRGYILVIPLKTCVKLYDDTFCDFGYAEYSFFQSSGPDDYKNYPYVCLVAAVEVGTVIQFNENCIAHSNNCDTCLLGSSPGYYSCITCISGYYSERQTEKCRPCPEELHCFQCIQQEIIRKDGWKTNVRAFYKKVIDAENTHPFVQYGQSQNTEDYEITCSFCQSGYELQNYKCIKSCPDNCFECQLINGQNQCVKCKQEYQGRGLSVINNQCTQCPDNCALCRIRSQEEMLQINPLFDDESLINFSYHCLKSFEDQPYYYDSQLSQFRQCTDNKVGCKQEFVIPINLYCSLDEYQVHMASLTTDDQKREFRQKNMLATDLFSGLSFKEFYNQEFYKLANQKLIKKIILQITSQQEQICQLQGNKVIEQSFSVHIFSAIEVEIEFAFNNKVTFQYDTAITFKDFTKITIQGLIFEPIINNQLKQLIFQSKLFQQIILNSITYQQNTDMMDQSQIIFQNLQQLSINTFKFINIHQNFGNNFFIIAFNAARKKIEIINISFQQCFFKDSSVLDFNLLPEDNVQIENVEISSKFQNVSLISLSSQVSSASLKLSKLKILNTELIDCISFLDVYKFQTVHISEMNLEMSKLSNSILIVVNYKKIQLENLQVKSTELRLSSMVISNSMLLVQFPIDVEINNLIFEANNYDETIKFISFKQLNHLSSNIAIKSLKLIGNQVFSISSSFNFQQTNSSLCYFQVSNLFIDGLEIQRGSGLTEMTFIETKYLKIVNALITQHNQFKFLGLHQYLDCQQKQTQGKYYHTSMLVYSSLQTIFEKFQITAVEIINYPLILFLSADLSFIKQKETLIIKDFQVSSNLLLLAQVLKQISLLQIQSSQGIDITLQNLKFEGNHLHEYIQNVLLNSATLIIIECQQGNVMLQDSQIGKNLVTNSSNSIIYINSKTTQILNCNFQYNGIFDYQILQPYILWGFSNQESINMSVIRDVFPVFQKAGNGIIISENVKIEYSYVYNSRGSQGGGFFITAQNNALISINHNIFSDISTHFINQGEKGGILYIESGNSLSLIYSMNNISATNIFSRNDGGLIYINGGVGQTKLMLNNINAQNIYSTFGSLAFIQFSSLSSSYQSLLITKIQIQDTLDGYLQFLGKFTNTKQSEQRNLMNNRTLIYTQYGNEIVLKTAKIDSLYFESLYQSINSQNIQISDFGIENSQLSKNLISVSPSQCNNLQNISICELFFNTKYRDLASVSRQESQKEENYFQCLAQPHVAPISLFDDSELFQSSGACLLEKMYILQDEDNLGLINLNELTNVSKVKILNIVIQDLECSKCQNGLILGQFNSNQFLRNQLINTITISKSNCGAQGCIIFTNNYQEGRRILQEEINRLDYELIVSDYACINNTAKYGTCLKVKNMSALLTNCLFKQNNATQAGGAIYFEGSQQFIIQNSLIEQNTAQFGGGLLFNDALMSNYSKLKTSFSDNQATLYGDSFVSIPSQLTIQMNEKDQIFTTTSIEKTEMLTVDEVIVKPYKLFGQSLSNQLYLPSGQEIASYQYFNWKQQTYNIFNWKLRLIPLNSKLAPQRMLTGTTCTIQGRSYNLSSKENNHPFTNNYTSFETFVFNDTSQDYNLDHIIITFDSNTAPEIVLQLQFQCNSIKVPIYNQNYPYNIIDFHTNYYLRLNVKTFQCQLGEIKENESCIQCDSSQGLFSLKINSNKCEIKNEETTVDVKSAQLNIRAGYWRPYLDTSEASYCLNLQENCLGGWISGDTSCYKGHIGALCEQCDLYNMRGDGYFSVSSTYYCGSCQEQSRNGLMIFAISTWTLISILISVKSTIASLKSNVRSNKIVPLGYQTTQNNANSAIYIKILTNYLQILAVIATFQLQVPDGFNYTINAVGNPLQSAAYSLDCFLTSIFFVEIHYARMIWQFILPLLYIALFFLFFGIGVKLRIVNYSKSVITTTLIYMYIYLQPNLVGGIIQLISYRNISGFLWVSANVAYRFDTLHHIEWVLRFALPGLIVVAFAIPALMFNGLKQNRLRLDEIQTKLNWGYLYNEYKKDAFFWEIVKICQKELIIIFLQFYEQNIVIKALLIMLIIFAYSELNNKFQPYLLKNLNTLDSYSAKICYLSIVIAIGVYMAEQQGVIEIQVPFFLLLAFINLYFLYILIYRILQEYITEADQKDEKIDKIRDKLRKQFPCLQNMQWFKRALQNRSQQKSRVQKQYQKLKSYLIPKAKQLITIKSQWNMPPEPEKIEQYKRLGSPSSDSLSAYIKQTGRENPEEKMYENNHSSQQFRTDSINASSEVRENNTIIDFKPEIRPSKFKFMQQE